MTPRRIVALARVACAYAIMPVSLLACVGCSKGKPAATPPAATTAQTRTATQSTAPTQPAADDASQDSLMATGKQLFTNYCASCHGETGDGNGPAARFLFPKPRNFREGKFRLVSTTNRIPSDNDIMHVIDRGMPGSAMFPFEHLSESDRKALVMYV